MTREHQLLVGLLVCETVIEALIRTHPDKAALRKELDNCFRVLKDASMTDESFGQAEMAHMETAMDAFRWQLRD